MSNELKEATKVLEAKLYTAILESKTYIPNPITLTREQYSILYVNHSLCVCFTAYRVAIVTYKNARILVEGAVNNEPCGF